MNRHLHRIAIACVLLAGCVGTETGNPPATAQLGMDTHSSDPDAVSIREDRGVIVVDEAWLSLEHVALVPSEACDRPNDIAGASLGAADHAAPAIAFLDLDAPATSFCELLVRFAPAPTLPTDAPPEIAEQAIVVRGRLADGTPFQLSTERTFEVDVRVPGNFELPENEDERGLFLGFDVAAWLSTTGLAQATPDAQGVINVSAEHNADVLSAFETNLAAGLELYRDADRDGRPDPGALLGRGGP